MNIGIDTTTVRMQVNKDMTKTEKDSLIQDALYATKVSAGITAGSAFAWGAAAAIGAPAFLSYMAAAATIGGAVVTAGQLATAACPNVICCSRTQLTMDPIHLNPDSNQRVVVTLELEADEFGRRFVVSEAQIVDHIPDDIQSISVQLGPHDEETGRVSVEVEGDLGLENPDQMNPGDSRKVVLVPHPGVIGV